MSQKLTESALRAQVQRLKSLPRGEDRPWGTDKEKGLRDELLRVLWEQSESNEEATRVIDRAMSTLQFCPAPVELAEVATALRLEVIQSAEWKPSTGTCEACGGSGFRSVKRKVRPLPGLPETEYDYAVRCNCAAPSGAAA